MLAMMGMVVCRGLGTCGTCAVQVVGKVVPEQWGNQERLRFKLPPHNSSRSAHLRLACQVNFLNQIYMSMAKPYSQNVWLQRSSLSVLCVLENGH